MTKAEKIPIKNPDTDTSNRYTRLRYLALKLDIAKVGLLQACKDIIETILFCLPNAHKGTVYRIGNPPELVAKQVTSGVIDEERTTISWGIPEKSRYAPPGRPWIEYRDEPGHPQEAMAWCVEKQESWTAENPDILEGYKDVPDFIK